MNGYGESLFDCDPRGKGVMAKQRQSLSSAKSVPYLSQHWTAGKVKGDRVVAPRSSFMRGLNLMVNPRPKLEILPVQSYQQPSRRSRTPDFADNYQRYSLLPANVTAGIVEGLLEAPQGHGGLTSDSERTCITQLYPHDSIHPGSSMTTLHLADGDDDNSCVSSRQPDQSRDQTGERSTDMILNMDDTPGSPRLRPDYHHMSEHSDLQSPTKRRADKISPVRLSKQVATTPTMASSFSGHEESQVLSNSASRLFARSWIWFEEAVMLGCRISKAPIRQDSTLNAHLPKATLRSTTPQRRKIRAHTGRQAGKAAPSSSTRKSQNAISGPQTRRS